jgi:hypothetical protein
MLPAISQLWHRAASFTLPVQFTVILHGSLCAATVFLFKVEQGRSLRRQHCRVDQLAAFGEFVKDGVQFAQVVASETRGRRY